MKTREEIRETTKSKIPRPADYKYGEKLKEWDASLAPGEEDLLEHCEPLKDRILVRLVNDPPKSAIVLTDAKPLIGGMRKAVVLKVGAGKWISDDDGLWRMALQVKVGDTVLIGNWVDLEANGICLCQEADVRVIVWQN